MATTVSSLKKDVDAVVKGLKADILVINGKFGELESFIKGTINDAFVGFTSGQTEALQTIVRIALNDSESNIRKVVDELLVQIKSELHSTIQKQGDALKKQGDELEAVKLELAQVKRAHEEDKRHVQSQKPNPLVIREIKERIANEPNLIISPISDGILEPNLALHVTQIVNSNTSMSLTPADVVSVKRLGRAGSQFKGVRVTFANPHVRHKVFSERRKFGKQQGDAPAVFLNPDLTRSQQEHKRHMLPLFKHIRDTNRQAGFQGKTPFFDEEVLFHYPNPQARNGYPAPHPANFDELAMAAAMPAIPNTSAAAVP